MPERGKIYFIIVDFPYPPLENVKINSLVYWINDISGSRPPLFPPILGKKEKRRSVEPCSRVSTKKERKGCVLMFPFSRLTLFVVAMTSQSWGS